MASCFVQVKNIQYTGGKWEWGSDKYHDNINQIKKEKNYDTIRADIADNIENHYEDTIKAIIFIEKNVNNCDMLDYLYNMYMGSSSILLNDSINEAISDYLNYKQDKRQRNRKTLKEIKNDLNVSKNNEINNSAVNRNDKMNYKIRSLIRFQIKKYRFYQAKIIYLWDIKQYIYRWRLNVKKL